MISKTNNTARKLFIFGTLILTFLCINTTAQTNLIENWDGNGNVNPTSSYPNLYGWDITVGEFNNANSTSGVRYTDVTSGHLLNGSNYSGRLLMVRWDGAGATTLNSVFSFPVILEANKRYAFSWIYEWWNNASSPVLTLGISTDKEGLHPISTKDFNCAAKNSLQNGDLSFHVATGQTYYITIKANNLAALCAIGELSLTEVEPALECSESSVTLNYFNTNTSLIISPNGSTDQITLSAPAGVVLSETSLPFTGGSVVVSSTDSTDVSENITITQGTDEIILPVSASFPEDFFKLAKIDTLTIDGAWCWFNDPRAIYYKGQKEQTYFGWINSRGDVIVAAYNHANGEYVEHLLFPELEVDDHDNPALFIRKDGRLVVYFSKHTSAPAHRFISNNPEDITEWGNDYQFGENVTYPYPFQVDDQILVFYRGLNWHPTLIVSDDDGETLGAPQLFITGGGDRPYARYCQDETGAIHVIFTTGHPRQEASNKIYYACYKEGKFFRADGSLIKAYTGTATALNIDKNEAEVVYNADQGKGWVWDITVDSENKPVLVFASFPSDTDHRYHYARWTGTEWFLKELTSAGRWFPQTPVGASEPEPNYSGGIGLDYDDPSIVYLSKQVNDVFEIFKYTTEDKGQNWKEQAITWNSPADIVNVRPIVPRNHKKGFFDVIWMRGKYRYYQDYHTSLVFGMDSSLMNLDSISISPKVLELKKGLSQRSSVTFFPFITSNKSITWTSSNENIASVSNGQITGINNGTATITAMAYNGLTASCEVQVSAPDYLQNALFDFGSANSPLTANAIRISETSTLENSYGWLSTVLSRDRGAGNTDERRDFNMSSSDALFKVLVKPGHYEITIVQGDPSYSHDLMNVYVNDELKVADASSTSGNFVSNTFDVTTLNDYLNFRFNDGGGTDVNWVVNSLRITEKFFDGIDSPYGSNEINQGTMTVYNILGRKIFVKQMNGSTVNTIMKGTQIPRGVYIIQLDTPLGMKSLKHYHKTL